MGVLSAAAENRRLVKKRTAVKLKASDYVGLPNNTAQNSSDNFPSYLQTTIIAQILSIGEEGGPFVSYQQGRRNDKTWGVGTYIGLSKKSGTLILALLSNELINRAATMHSNDNAFTGPLFIFMYLQA